MDESPLDTGAEAGSILSHPDAQALLDDATLTRQAVVGCRGRLTRFLERYLPLFYRREQRGHAALVVRGLLSGLGRKTCEPIAREAGVHRKLVQSFVGSGRWDDEAVMAGLRRHVAEELADPAAVLVVDGSGFPKKGAESCGVKRQWCGRLGKVENCQVGVFLAYAAAGGHAPLGRRLYLPEDWAGDPARREKCHVPPEVVYKEKWRIALELLDEARGADPLPHAWVAGDDEFGRVSAFRAALRGRGERYVLDVPCNTLVRDLDARRPPRKRAGRGRRRAVPFARADVWAARQPAGRWQAFTVRGGAKGPLRVEAMAARVRAKDEAGRVGGAEERLVVVRTVEPSPRTSYCLSDAAAPADAPLAELLRAHAERHRIERVIEEGKGEAGLGHYEVRGWVGWHHHMTLALLALWFLATETRRVGGKNAGDHGATGTRAVLAAAE